MRRKKAQFFLVIILSGIAVVLGILVAKGGGQEISLQTRERPKEEPSPFPRRPLPADLTDEERALLSPPAPNAPKEEKDKHFELLQKLAKESAVLDLNGCTKPDPLVLKLQKGSEFKVKSSDDLGHTIVINQDYKFNIPAGQTATFKADFPFGDGAYGYLCDSQPGVVGFFSVTSE